MKNNENDTISNLPKRDQLFWFKVKREKMMPETAQPFRLVMKNKEKMIRSSKQWQWERLFGASILALISERSLQRSRHNTKHKSNSSRKAEFVELVASTESSIQAY